MFLLNTLARKRNLPGPGEALPGRANPIATAETHLVTGHRLAPPYPDGMAEILLGLGCFWGAERLYWQVPGVHVTAVGYAGGITPNPTYQEVCTGLTGHTEIVRVVYDPAAVSLDALLKIFWEAHDPTQGMRQGNDVGTQYRSAIYTTAPEQAMVAEVSKEAYAAALKGAGRGDVTTEILADQTFYFAEDYHQQYLAKNPNGYCGLAGTGVTCPAPAGN